MLLPIPMDMEFVMFPIWYFPISKFTYDNNCLTAPFAMPLALSLYMSFVLLLDMSFAEILVMI
jgi:hypothetical protein